MWGRLLEAELEEIVKLVNGGARGGSSTRRVEQRSEVLISVQEESLKVHEEFTATYEGTVQSVAMSEGLDRSTGHHVLSTSAFTEVQRDEQSAGKIDEMLANLEFLCEEVEQHR